MADRAVNQRVWSHKNVSKTTRFLAGELKRRPAFIRSIETRLTLGPDKKLLVDGLEVVPIEDVTEVIKTFDNDPRYGGGRDRLYGHISRQKAGITRSMVAEYISNSESHQLTQPKPRVIRNRAIVVSGVGKQAQFDLVGPLDDPALNNGYQYILTFIDLFSKWAAARPLKNKEGPSVIEGADSILESVKPEHRPRVFGRVRTTYENEVGS